MLAVHWSQEQKACWQDIGMSHYDHDLNPALKSKHFGFQLRFFALSSYNTLTR